MTSNSPIDFVSIMKTINETALQDLVQSDDFADWMNDYLSNHTLVVEFIKKDGEKRKLRCTRNMSMIPDAMRPKGTKASSATSIAAFDLDKGEWRSFIPATITHIEWGMSHENLH